MPLLLLLAVVIPAAGATGWVIATQVTATEGPAALWGIILPIGLSLALVLRFLSSARRPSSNSEA